VAVLLVDNERRTRPSNLRARAAAADMLVAVPRFLLHGRGEPGALRRLLTGPAARRRTTTDIEPPHFIRAILQRDIETATARQKAGAAAPATAVLRFPPEPNGRLHLGHAKAICLNFGLAEQLPGAKCNLRFDDTNPAKAHLEYVDAAIRDVQWLGCTCTPSAWMLCVAAAPSLIRACFTTCRWLGWSRSLCLRLLRAAAKRST
jgi:hypothetical protein